MNSGGATLQGSYTGATGTISEVGFYYGTSSGNLPNKVVATGTSSPFSKAVTGLSASTTYYYKAYVLEYSEVAGGDVYRYGDESSFTTSAATPEKLGWLEMPSYTASAMSGTTTSSLSDLYKVTHYATLNASTVRNYTLLYDPEMYASYWVAYPLCSAHLGTGRDEEWAYDPSVPNAKQTNAIAGAYGVNISTPNYDSNVYARGHQLPNADRTVNDSMSDQTYYMTNITPQIQNGFNGGVWNNLEAAIRGLTSSCDTVYVVTGAAFRKKTVGTESITTIVNTRDSKTLPVPNYYWKALLKVTWSGDAVTDASAIGFWLPHQDLKGANYASYTVSVDQIEAWTGFDLFANLPVALQNTAETNANWNTFSSF